MRRKFDHCRDLLFKSPVLPADLIISKFSLMKLHTDLKQRKKIRNLECMQTTYS